MSTDVASWRTSEVVRDFTTLVKSNIRPRIPEYRRRERAGIARLRAVGGHGDTTWLPSQGALSRPPRALPGPDRDGHARLRELDQRLASIQRAFPAVATEVEMCRLACEMLERVWLERATAAPAAPDEDGCGCPLCTSLPVPPPRRLDDYGWRASRGRPLTVKIWPYRPEFDSVLTQGWVWARRLTDSDIDLGLRFRYDDDILAFSEYERVVRELDMAEVARGAVRELAADFSVNGARALVVGVFTAYKRSLDHYWIDRHLAGDVGLVPANPLDQAAHALLQLMDCLYWHVSPDAELWHEENLAALVLCRVLDDMVDVRADAVTGEVDNFWLSTMSTHDKAVYAASAIAMTKFECMPESHGVLWKSRLMTATTVWLGLTGRHGVWFDGITDGVAPTRDCPLCGLEPDSCTGLLTDGVKLRIGPRRAVPVLGAAAARLSARCRAECPEVWPLFHGELGAFEAVHGEWHGDVDGVWQILRRTYVAAVEASLRGGDLDRARDVQADAGAVGADLFYLLAEPPTSRENTDLLAFMFGCAHPHFLWNCLGHDGTTVGGDPLDY